MYDYATQREELFTDAGQRLFIAVRDQVHRLIKESGAVRMQEAMRLPRGVGAASSWDLLACVDRLVELGEIREVTSAGTVAGQHRVCVSTAR